jgi:hypothetical protein
VIQFHEEHQARLAQPFANYAFELCKRRRSRCPFRERNYVRMAYSGFNRCQYFVEWPGRDQVESLDLNFGYHPDHLSYHFRQACRVPRASFSRSRAFQHGSYTVLSFGPPERCSERSEGVEEPIERRQRDFVDEMLCRDESATIEGADPACEGIDEAVQLGIRKGSVHITVSFRCIAIEVVGTQNDFERPPAPHQVRKALCASAPGMQPNPEFGVAELRVLARGEPHVAGKNELAAHAAHAAPDSCEADDRRFR